MVAASYLLRGTALFSQPDDIASLNLFFHDVLCDRGLSVIEGEFKLSYHDDSNVELSLVFVRNLMRKL